jgi:hypothetical protein
MAFQPAAIEAGHDPRAHLSENGEPEAYIPENNLLPDGSTPNIETYMYYAKIQREKEAALSAQEDAEGGHWGSLISRKFRRSNEPEKNSVASVHSGDNKGATSSEHGFDGVVIEGEYRAASGALRTATWGSVFYLITTGTLFETLITLLDSHRSLRYFGSLFHTMGISTSWIWSRCRLLLRVRYHGCIQWPHPVVAVPETRLGEIPGQVFR